MHIGKSAAALVVKTGDNLTAALVVISVPASTITHASRRCRAPRASATANPPSSPTLTCRLFMLANGVKFKDELISLEEWDTSERQRMKESGEQPGGACRVAARGASHWQLSCWCRRLVPSDINAVQSLWAKGRGDVAPRTHTADACRAPAGIEGRGQVLLGAHCHLPLHCTPGAASPRRAGTGRTITAILCHGLKFASVIAKSSHAHILHVWSAWSIVHTMPGAGRHRHALRALQRQNVCLALAYSLSLLGLVCQIGLPACPG